MFTKTFKFFISLLIIICEPVFWVLEKILVFNSFNGEAITLILRGRLHGLYWNCKNLKFGNNIKLVNPQNFKFGKNVTLHNCGNYITAKNNTLEVGDNTHIGRYSVMAGGGGISIGSNCAVSANVIIYSVTNSIKNPQLPVVKQTESAKVTVGNNVLLGASVVILPGVTIGNNSVIGAGSTVTRDIPENSIAIGSPAKVIRLRDKS